MIDDNHQGASAGPNGNGIAVRPQADSGLPITVHCTVYDEVEIASHLDRSGEDLIAIRLGERSDPRLTLDFFDVSALLRLSEVAAEAARRLQARIDEDSDDQASDDDE